MKAPQADGGSVRDVQQRPFDHEPHTRQAGQGRQQRVNDEIEQPSAPARFTLGSRALDGRRGSRRRQLCLHPGQFVVHVVARGEGVQLGLQVVAAAGQGGVLQRA